MELVEDIEDLITGQDLTPKDRYYSNEKVITRAKKQKKGNASCTVNKVVPESHNIYVKTWGCAHNNSDSEYMAGQLAAYGYNLTNNMEEADLWLLNSCTVKNPSEDTFRNNIESGLRADKRIVVAGCVPQGAPKSAYLNDLSIIGVLQIDRVVEVVEETLKGHTVRFLQPKKEKGRRLPGARLNLPKIRKNPFIEIIPINSGCLNQCTYCKTKHARGDLASYSIDEIVERARQAFAEGCKEIWLTSEDTGAYGIDIGTTLPDLLWKLIEVIPDNCMMRIGMTNPPYILIHLEEVAKILKHRNVYSFLHVPVQSGSDAVLGDMKREYCRNDFEHVIDFLRIHVPDITIATDIICGFPTETEEDFEETMQLCAKYCFPSLFINQFFPRPGTPAAKLKRIPANLVKKRTKKLTDLFYDYQPYKDRIGMEYIVLITEISTDKKYYVGHNKSYEQILVPMYDNILGTSVKVRVTNITKFCMIADKIDITENANILSKQIKLLTANPLAGTKYFEFFLIIGIMSLFFKLCHKVLEYYI